jgi:toxin ParE1/3/4
MSFALAVTDRAATEIAAARAEYAEHGKAAEFIASVDHVFERLSEHPRMYPVIYATVHRALLRRFPFAVFFVVEDSEWLSSRSARNAATLLGGPSRSSPIALRMSSAGRLAARRDHNTDH